MPAGEASNAGANALTSMSGDRSQGAAPQLAANETTKRLLQLAAGAGSGIITKTTIAPLERIKILFQVQGMMQDHSHYGRSIPNALRIVVKEEGVVGLWKGNGANVSRVIPVYALKFMFNDTFRDMVARPGQNVKELTFRQMMLAGTFAGLFQATITYPLETIRTRLSLAERYGNTYKGILDCAVQTTRHEGALALYKGIVATYLSGGPYVGLQMTFYQIFQRTFPKDSAGESHVFWKMTAGACAGIIAQTITFPGDTMRRRMQTNGIGGQPRVYDGTIDCARKIFRREGFMGFYRGWYANFVRCIPGAAIEFACYDYLKRLLGC